MYSITKVWRSDSQNEFQNKTFHSRMLIYLVHSTWKSTLCKSPFCIPIYIHLQLSIRVLWGLLVLKTSHICLWRTKVRKLMSKIAPQQLIILMHLLWPLACVLVTFLIRPKSSYTNIWFWVVAISIKLLLLLIAFNLLDDLTSTIT